MVGSPAHPSPIPTCPPAWSTEFHTSTFLRPQRPHPFSAPSVKWGQACRVAIKFEVLDLYAKCSHLLLLFCSGAEGNRPHITPPRQGPSTLLHRWGHSAEA